jgi:hypothetical protein
MVTRKNVRILILLACGIALVLAASSCKKKEEEPKEPNIPPDKGIGVVTPPDKGPEDVTPPDKKPPVLLAKTLVVEPLVGIDKVRFGMTVEEMKQVLGEPQRSRVPLHEYRDFGFAIFAINNAVTMIACGSRRSSDSPLIKNCKVRTSKGIGMGSGKEDVISSYGQPSSTQQLPGVSNAVSLKYDQLGSEFLLMDDKVVYMMFRTEGFGGGFRTPRPGSM